MKKLKFISIFLVALLAGCGGGSSSPKANVSNELSLGALSPQSISMTLPKLTNTSALPGVSLTASYTGSTASNIYVLIEDTDKIVIAGTVMVNSNSTATLTLYLDQSVPVGTYTQPIKIRVCKDITCTAEFAGSPQTIQKNIVIANIGLSQSTLNFTSSAGIAPSAQSVIVTVPNGSSVSYTDSTYFYYTAPNGSTGAGRIQDAFEVITTGSSIQVQPKGYDLGHYEFSMYVASLGFEPVRLLVTYDIGPIAPQNLIVQTTSATQSSTVNSKADLPIFINVVETSAIPIIPNVNVSALSTFTVDIVYDPNIPISIPYQWLRFYSQTYFTDGSGSANNGLSMRFFANACFISCLPSGTYKANIVLTSTSFATGNTISIPVTFTVN
jgi:hypothetical protein